ASISDLNLMRAATGSQWRSIRSGVMCALFGWLNTRRAAAFWIICSGFTTQAGRPVRRALQESRREFTKVCTSIWVAYWVRYGLILRMLNSAKRQDLETEAMCAVKVSWSSIMTPRFLAVLDGTVLDALKLSNTSIRVEEPNWRQSSRHKTLSQYTYGDKHDPLHYCT